MVKDFYIKNGVCNPYIKVHKIEIKAKESELRRVNIENIMKVGLNEISTKAFRGIRYLTPFLFNLDVCIDTKLRPRISLSNEIFNFPKTAIFKNYDIWFKAVCGLSIRF